MSWYALFVETGKEDMVRNMILKFINESAIRAIVPKRKLQERKQGRTNEIYKTMFPGYVFVNTKMNEEIYYDLKRLPKYNRLLIRDKPRDQSNKNFHEVFRFSEIDEEEMTLILQLIGNEELIDYSTLYVENAKVIVCAGPLKGKEGLIKKIDKRKKRARIVLNILGNEVLLDVGIEVLASPS
ncbi:antiterminator LoaP [Brevibacillus sp. NPDC003359]|uniref:antiterminator LoaP n=1 Tax=unclassified Brevibacillus TaxID=2684853 RepID=UPI00368B74B0